MNQVFFYGLFMDMEFLREMGLAPKDSVNAELENYHLRIGSRAGLVPSQNAIAYGVLTSLSREDLEKLYATPGVEAYKPISVTVKRMDNSNLVKAICYNVSEEEIGNFINQNYAIELAQLVRRLQFPASYAAAIERGA